jgi:hypothetical protein
MASPLDLVKYCFLAVGFPMMYRDPGAGKNRKCISKLGRGHVKMNQVCKKERPKRKYSQKKCLCESAGQLSSG